MKIRSVKENSRKQEFSVVTFGGKSFSFPYSKTKPRPTAKNRVAEVFVDKELGKEAFTYILESGKEGSVHIDHVLEYNEDPKYLADLLTYKMSVEAKRGIEESSLSRRQLAHRLKTSVPQLYRLLDPENTSKSMSQLVALLHLLDRDVDVVIKKKSAA
jgi:hypothetical protein